MFHAGFWGCRDFKKIPPYLHPGRSSQSRDEEIYQEVHIISIIKYEKLNDRGKLKILWSQRDKALFHAS